MDLILKDDGFMLRIDGKLLISHSYDDPCAYLGGQGREKMRMRFGNFAIDDEIITRIPLKKLRN